MSGIARAAAPFSGVSRQTCYRWAVHPVASIRALPGSDDQYISLVTVPLSTSGSPAPAAPPAEPAAVKVPLSWLLEHAAAPIQYRALTELAEVRPASDAELETMILAYPPALRLAVGHAWDGTGPGGMLGVPKEGTGLETAGTILAVRRLLEYGWSRESPPLLRARRYLFRLLAEDDDPAFLYDLAAGVGDNEGMIAHGRLLLREAAGAALAQAGYESDPRLRGAATRAIERLREFLRSPLAENPWVGTGASRALNEDAAPPSMHLLIMLAHMPVFRLEHHDTLEELFAYLSRRLPRTEARQHVGDEIVPVEHLALGDPIPSKAAMGADMPGALLWLETMARLGFLARHEGWSKLLDRLLDERDRHGVWRGGRAGNVPPAPTQASVWPSYPLEEEQADERSWTDVTFRLALIARLAGRPLEIV